MKKFVVGVLGFLLTGCSTAISESGAEQSTARPAIAVEKQGNVTNYKTTGNLAVTLPISCVDVRQLTSDHTPADIYTGISDCLSRGDIDRASKLYALAFVYGYYDRLRVADRSAHQAIKVLELNHLGPVDEVVSRKMSERVSQISADGDALGALCVAITSLGKPGYHPGYMIQHGIGAFSGGHTGNGLRPDFSKQEGWRMALDKGLHCPS